MAVPIIPEKSEESEGVKSIINKSLGNSAKLWTVTANQGKPHSHGISLKLGHALKGTKQLNLLCWLIEIYSRMRCTVFLLIGSMEKDMLLMTVSLKLK